VCGCAGAPAAWDRELTRGERGTGVPNVPAKCSVLQRAREMRSADIAAGAHTCGNCQCAMAASIEVLQRLRRCEAQCWELEGNMLGGSGTSADGGR
jgi:hypothetical protein